MPTHKPSRSSGWRLLPFTLLQKRRVSSSTDINSLPSELLVSIIKHLPWRDRAKVERVNKHWRHLALTYGWSDAEHFDIFSSDSDWKYGFGDSMEDLSEESRLQITKHLLDRCGTHVKSVSLYWNMDSCQVSSLLERCPRVTEISFNHMDIDTTVIGTVRDRNRRISLRYNTHCQACLFRTFTNITPCTGHSPTSIRPTRVPPPTPPTF